MNGFLPSSPRSIDVAINFPTYSLLFEIDQKHIFVQAKIKSVNFCTYIVQGLAELGHVQFSFVPGFGQMMAERDLAQIVENSKTLNIKSEYF